MSLNAKLVIRWALLLAVLNCSTGLHADAILFVGEPFGHFGAVNPTGHASIYLPGICASSPTVLRRCRPDELGVVISRYHRIGGYDWIAIPLIPYLYAVDRIEDVPTDVDPSTVASLRDSYRHRHLQNLVPDDPEGKIPEGNWVQLVGAAYDRKLYGFRIDTSESQDQELIDKLNSSANQSHFNLLFNNCADFTRSVLDFYYPKAVRRSFVADGGITTPKQIAKSLVQFGKRHPEVHVSAFYVPQVPGNEPRSHGLHGVSESLLKSKKYILPLAALHPWIAGGVAAAYIAGGRFNISRYAETEYTPDELPLLRRSESHSEAGHGLAISSITGSNANY